MHWRAPDGQRPSRFPAEKSFALFGVDPTIEVFQYAIMHHNYAFELYYAGIL